MTDIKVSLIIPVYNVEAYLEDCLNSAINQSLKEIEIICVNDGSTDKSADILKRYSKKDKRIQIITQKNKGLSGARNSGLKVARGEFISFLDSDDELELDALEEMYKYAKEEKLLALFGTYTKIYTDKKLTYIPKISPDHALKDFLNSLMMPLAVASLFDRKMLLEHNFSFKEGIFYEDCLSTLQILHYAKGRAGAYKQSVYKYKIRQNSIIKSFSKKHASDFIIMLDSMRDFLVQNDIYHEHQKAFFKFCLTHFSYLVKNANLSNNGGEFIGIVFEELKKKDYFTKELFDFLRQEFLYVYIMLTFSILKNSNNLKSLDAKKFLSFYMDENDLQTLSKYAQKHENIYEVMADFLHQKSITNVAIYGAGEGYAILKKYLKRYNIKVDILMDKKAQNGEFLLDNIKVQTYHEALLECENPSILITSINMANTIKEELEKFCKEHKIKYEVYDVSSIIKSKKE